MSEYKCESGKAPLYVPHKPVTAVIGASFSVVSIMVANILRLFKIPQVSYASTSTELSDKSRFEYFSRVVPPDNFQAQTMVEIIKEMGWKYVSTVAVEGDYGERVNNCLSSPTTIFPMLRILGEYSKLFALTYIFNGNFQIEMFAEKYRYEFMKLSNTTRINLNSYTKLNRVIAENSVLSKQGIASFISYSADAGICIAVTEKILRNSKTEDFDRIIDRLLQKSARAVVLFVDEDNTRKLLQATIRANKTGHFLWIGSDSWGAKVHPVRDQEFAAEGAITILPHRNAIQVDGCDGILARGGGGEAWVASSVSEVRAESFSRKFEAGR
ncbi:hypothetical protein MTP99_019078 [Tenebrio molitor]|nr:hypothetical protein MTP99_019078 [Tenebrio molitor]